MTGNALKTSDISCFHTIPNKKASELSGVSIGLSADGMGVSGLTELTEKLFYVLYLLGLSWVGLG